MSAAPRTTGAITATTASACWSPSLTRASVHCLPFSTTSALLGVLRVLLPRSPHAPPRLHRHHRRWPRRRRPPRPALRNRGNPQAPLPQGRDVRHDRRGLERDGPL